MSIFKPVTVITGASAGIGAALARVFAKNGHEVALVARREKEMVLLATELAVSASTSRMSSPPTCSAPTRPRASRTNCSGAGSSPRSSSTMRASACTGRPPSLDRAEQLAMIDLNVRALTDLSLRWIDGIVKHKGGILNVASVAGFLPGPGMAVYYASKAYVLSFTEALSRELEPQGVRVTVLCPGPVKTEFQMRAGVDTRRPRRPARAHRRAGRAGRL